MSTQPIGQAAAPHLHTPEESAITPSAICAIPVRHGPDAKCDEQDFAFLSLFKWRLNHFTATCLSYPITELAGRDFFMHQLVLLVGRKTKINHRDRDTLNNCRANLRMASVAQVLATRPKNPKLFCSSIYKGVMRQKKETQWCAAMRVSRVRRIIGYFDTEEAAGRAYDQAAFEIYGEFACLNFPHSQPTGPSLSPNAEPARILATTEGQTIPTSNGLDALCDPEDFLLLSRLTWRVERFGDFEYAVARLQGELIFMHHAVLGRGQRSRVIHRDGNGLNNQRSNLLVLVARPVDPSCFKGVQRGRNGKWRARLNTAGTFKYLGTFQHEEDAARAYDAAARAAFGSFAYQNFPEESH